MTRVDIYRRFERIGDAEIPAALTIDGQRPDREAIRRHLIADGEWPPDIHVEIRRNPSRPNHA